MLSGVTHAGIKTFDGLVNTEWNNAGNWQGATLPGVATGDLLTLAESTDYVVLTDSVTLPNTADLYVSGGAQLYLRGKLSNLNDVDLGGSSLAGGHLIVRDVLDLAGGVTVGTTTSSSDSTFRVSEGRATGTYLNVVKGEAAIQGTWPQYIDFDNVSVENDGRLRYICVQGGVDPITSSTFTINSGANLIVDITDYRGYHDGATTIDLMYFSSRVGSFDPSNITIKGLSGGTISYLSDRMILTLNSVVEPIVDPVNDYSGYSHGNTFLEAYPAETDFTNYPEFSWDTTPRWMAFRDRSRSTDDEIEDIAIYPLVMLEKSNEQGLAGSELGCIDLSLRLKAVNPLCKTLFYMNSDIMWGGYEATAEYDLNEWRWSKRTINSEGVEVVKTVYGRQFPNREVPEMRDWWLDTILGVVAHPAVDGAFIDRIVPSYFARPVVDGIAARGYFEMLNTLYEEMPTGKYIVGNASDVREDNGTRSLFHYLDGPYFEGWTENGPEFIALVIQHIQEASSRGKITLFRSGGDGTSEATLAAGVEFPLAVYLMAAGPNTYFAYQDKDAGHFVQWQWDTSWIDELTRPLGEPLGDAVYDGYLYTRSFRYLDVSVNVDTKVASFNWKDPADDGLWTLNDGTVVSATGSNTMPTVSSTDLAQTQYLSSSATGGNEVSSQHAELFNGLLGNEDGSTADSGEVTLDSGNTFTVTLDTSVNTNGYDITGIDSVFGWNSAGGGRANQGYEVIMTFMDNSTQTLSSPYHWEPNSSASYWTKVSFTAESEGVIASGVKAVTFNITEDAIPGGVVVAREIDVFGAPSLNADISVTSIASNTMPTVSSTDLAQTEYLSSYATGGNEVSSQHAELFNGLLGNTDGSTADSGEVTMNSTNTYTVEFDVSVNTLGYDISSIDSIFGWNSAGGGRANQGYSITVTYVDNTTATLVGAQHWEPNSPASYWTKVSFSPRLGQTHLAIGVKAITFDITENANPGGVVVAREIDVFGTVSF